MCCRCKGTGQRQLAEWRVLCRWCEHCLRCVLLSLLLVRSFTCGAHKPSHRSYNRFSAQTYYPPQGMIPYYDPNNPSNSVFGRFNTDLLSIIQTNGNGNLPIWVTETGGATNSASSNYGLVLMSLAEQNTLVQQAYQALMQQVIPNLERVYW